jgi:AcrR family transcriptional regulator
MSVYSTSGRTKQALIDAAGELIAEFGVGRVSTRAIADRAGENLGTIHYHFGGKEGLLKEVLRFACQENVGPSFREVIEECRPHLDTVEGQARAVGLLVHCLMRMVFSPDRPRWCSRVLYQVAQHAGPLRTFLREKLRDPHLDAIKELVLHARPEWSPHEVYLWAYLLIGAVVFHADHAEMILDRLGSRTFPPDYLARLEQRLIEDAARALGLPANALQEHDHQAPRRKKLVGGVKK